MESAGFFVPETGLKVKEKSSLWTWCSPEEASLTSPRVRRAETTAEVSKTNTVGRSPRENHGQPREGRARGQRWNAVVPVGEKGPGKRPGTHNRAEGKTQGATEDAKGEGGDPPGQRGPACPGERAGHHGQQVRQERPGQTGTRQRKTEGPEGVEDTGTRKGVVPEGGETPQKTAGPRGETETGLVHAESSKALRTDGA